MVVKMQTLRPNSFSHQVFYRGRAGITIMYLSIANRYFSWKNSTNMMSGGSSYAFVEGFF